MKLRDASARLDSASTARAQGVIKFGAIRKPGEKSVPLKNRESCGTRDFIPKFHQTPQAVLRSTQDKKPTLPKFDPPTKAQF